MRIIFSIILSLLSSAGMAAQPPLEIDPNTKIQGGADIRGSGAAAGAGMRRDSKMGTEPRVEPPRNDVPGPDRTEPDNEKPISERKPREDERQYPGKEPAIRAPSSN